MALRTAVRAQPGLRKQIEQRRWHEQTVHTTAEIGRVVGDIIAAMVAADYPGRDVFGMHQALGEALVNAVVHGNGGDPAKSVRVRYRVTDRRVQAQVEDEGPGFDPEAVPDPTAPENLTRPSGRGLLLMRHFMTWVHHNERGNWVRLCKERSAS
jgi:serine/threonine-protein kinase RsbW